MRAVADRAHPERVSRRPAGSTSGAAFRGERLRELFAGLEHAPALVLAVSGGPDSMALMYLAARWVGQEAAGAAGPELHVATVDHGLRPEAAAEAAFVAEAAADLGLRHTNLRWEGAKPTTRIQERARMARYGLLVDHARAVGASHVLTAHHADDQAETVLMRLGRGSGVAGLAGMLRETALAQGVTLVRPLLGEAKAALVAFCRQEGDGRYIEDPSNSDPAFARVRLRRQADAALALGLDRRTLLRLADRMMRAEVALDDASLRLDAQLAPILASGEWSAVLAPISDAAPELLRRVLRRAIEHVRGSPGHVAPLRLDRLESLADDLHAALAARTPLRATLGGTRIELRADTSMRITPEARRRRGRPPQDDRPAPLSIVKSELPRTLGSLGK